jgi:hypothetical protein
MEAGMTIFRPNVNDDLVSLVNDFFERVKWISSRTILPKHYLETEFSSVKDPATPG